MLGREVMARLGERGVGGDLPEVDITRKDQVAEWLDRHRPGCLINCAAYTDVDAAESNPDAARRLNADAVELLGRLCRERDIHLITLSTDYVFTGEGMDPWPEEAPTGAFGPGCVYGRTKLEGERRLAAVGGRWALVRTQWLYEARARNFANTILKLAAERTELKVVNDQVGAPTWAACLAEGLVRLAEAGATGYFHAVNSGFASWFEVAQFLTKRLGLDCTVRPCTSEQFPRPATRPKNCRLDQSRFARLEGGPMIPWQEALEQYLRSTGRLGPT